jgi:SAM-dependent methyltransferase
VGVSPMPTADELAALYGGEYFEGDYHCGHKASYEEESFSEEHKRVLDRFLKLKPSGRMLEVGAAGGKFLLGARARGYEVKGVEVSAHACEMARGLGLDHFCGELEAAKFPDGSFDLVYMGDVLEHLPRPFSALRELNRVLSTRGVVCLSCPTNIGLLSSRAGLLVYRLLSRERVAPIPPYHLYEFTPSTLAALVKGAGFEVVELDAGIIPPWKIKLRGGIMEKAMKAAFHWPNYIITKLTGFMGDRVTVYARKK